MLEVDQIGLSASHHPHHHHQLTSQQQSQFQHQLRELNLKVMDGPGQEQDRRQLYMLLNYYLSYPSTYHAKVHRQANQLGMFDVSKEERYIRISKQNTNESEQFRHICRCCGFIVQTEELGVCGHKLEQIHNLGIATYLYFKTSFNLIILLLIMFIIYSLYSLITNIVAANMQTQGYSASTLLNFLSISLGSKQLYASGQKTTLYVVGAWIGLFMLLLWAVAFIGLKYYQKEQEVRIMTESKSVAQFSVVIENIPTGLTRADLQRQLRQYVRRLREDEEQTWPGEIEVIKYSQGQPFYLNQDELTSPQLQKVLKTEQNYLERFRYWVLHRQCNYHFHNNKAFRLRKYKQFERIKKRKGMIIQEITQKIKGQYQKKNKEHMTTAFVTFGTNTQKNMILEHNQETIAAKIRRLVPFLKSKERLVLKKDEKQYDQLRILPAPDPEDIVWRNIGVSRKQIFLRKLLTSFITILILGVSFVICYGLSTAQAHNQTDTILSLLISVSISSINLLIQVVIQLLSAQERDYTMTNYQTSMGLKSVIAQLINSIFIPITANYFIKQNIYYQHGLVSDVFVLSITNSFVYPLAKAIYPSFILYYCWARYKLMPRNKLDYSQCEVNQSYEKNQFEVGYEYIYIVNLFVFTCFFVSLQPIIPIFAILGLLLNYWVQKYNLFHRSQRPVPGTPIIHTTLSQVIYFGAIAYTLGSMTWANFLPSSEFKVALLPNLFALSAAVIIFLLPYESLFNKMFKSKAMPQMTYKDNRIFFTSQYDRLNPSSAETGVKQYYAFLKHKIKQLENMDHESKLKLSLELEYASRPNFYRQTNEGHQMSATRFHPRKVVSTIIDQQTHNNMTPQLIANILMKDQPENQGLKNRLFHSISKVYKPKKSLPGSKKKDLSIEAEEEQDTTEQFQKGLNAELEGQGKKMSVLNSDKKIENKQFFNEISQVKSFIIKAESNEQLLKKTNAEFSFKKKMPTEQQQEIPDEKEQKGADKELSVYMDMKLSQQHFFQSQSSRNRYSINGEKMLPVCVGGEEANLSRSSVYAYNVASFQ